jgi:flagellin
LDTALSNLFAFRAGLDDAASRIEDVDVAEASALLVRSQILQESANAILAQAIVQPEIVLKLLQDTADSTTPTDTE